MMKLPETGDVIDETYEIQRVLGTGGFGAVYLARQINMDRDVALKLLVASGPKFAEMVKRFRREVMAIRNLSHPNTIRVYDFRDNPEGLLYYTMEALKGHTLKDEVRAHGPLSPRRLKRVMRQVLKSLSEAHSHGLVHRDLKPANIMIVEMHGETDFVKVLDFGIAKMMLDGGDEQDEQLTSAGILVGTLRYMAPEQISADFLGPQTDLYALGLIAVEMLTGESVFAGTGRWEVLRQQISEEPVPLPEEVRGSTLGAVIEKCLKKHYHERYATAAEVLKALDDIPDTALSEEPLFVSDGAGGWVANASSGRQRKQTVVATVPETTRRGVDEFESAKTMVMDVSENIHPVDIEELEEIDATVMTEMPRVAGQGLAVGAPPLERKHTVPATPSQMTAPPAMPIGKTDVTATSDQIPQFSPGGGQKKSAKTGLIVGVLALVVLAIVAVAGLVFFGGDEAGEEEGALAAVVDAENEGEEVGTDSSVEEADAREMELGEAFEEEEESVEPFEVLLRTGNVRASIYVGDDFKGRTPYRLLIEDEPVAVRIEARGFEDLEITVGRDSEERLDLELVAMPEPEPEPRPQAATTPTPRPDRGASTTSSASGRQGSTPSRQETEPNRGSDWVDIPAPAAEKEEKKEVEIPLF